MFTPLIASRTVEVIERLAGLAAVAVDRAGTKMIERHARQRVEELAGLKDDFLSTVSHELRTPVTVIRGVVELLRRDPNTGTNCDPNCWTGSETTSRTSPSSSSRSNGSRRCAPVPDCRC